MFKEAYSNSKKQGDAGLGVAIGYFASKGITVCVPLTDSQDYDLVVENQGLQKVQVRTTSVISRYGIFKLNLRVCGGNRSGTGKVKHFDKTKVDYIFALTSNGSKYLIPAYQIEAINELHLGQNFERYRLE